MPLITNNFYYYNFPQIRSEDAAAFDTAMNRIFEYCKGSSKDIVQFLNDTIVTKRKYTLDNILQSVDISEADGASFANAMEEVNLEVERINKEAGERLGGVILDEHFINRTKINKDK